MLPWGLDTLLCPTALCGLLLSAENLPSMKQVYTPLTYFVCIPTSNFECSVYHVATQATRTKGFRKETANRISVLPILLSPPQGAGGRAALENSPEHCAVLFSLFQR